jgi:hypothetical protein
MGMEGMQSLAAPAIRRWLTVGGVGVATCIAAIMLLSGCVNTCQDNPRNMQCMSADQLKHELGVK